MKKLNIFKKNKKSESANKTNQTVAKPKKSKKVNKKQPKPKQPNNKKFEKIKKLKFNKNIFMNLAFAILSVLIIGGLSSFFTDGESNWYVNLIKPSEYMPSIVFPIMWGIIYALLAITIFILLQKKKMENCTIILFIVNGLMQILWCFIYFTMQSLLGGVIVIIATLIVSILLWVNVYGKDKLSGYILALYPVWLAVATALNMATWILN